MTTDGYFSSLSPRLTRSARVEEEVATSVENDASPPKSKYTRQTKKARVEEEVAKSVKKAAYPLKLKKTRQTKEGGVEEEVVASVEKSACSPKSKKPRQTKNARVEEEVAMSVDKAASPTKLKNLRQTNKGTVEEEVATSVEKAASPPRKPVTQEVAAVDEDREESRFIGKPMEDEEARKQYPKRYAREMMFCLDSEVDSKMSNGVCAKSEVSLLDLYLGCEAMSTGLCLGAHLGSVNLVTVRNEAAEDFLKMLKEWRKYCFCLKLVETDNLDADVEKSMLEFFRKEDDEEEEDVKGNVKDDSEMFEVDYVGVCFGDSKKNEKKGIYLKIYWKGYRPEEDTWEPMNELDSATILIYACSIICCMFCIIYVSRLSKT